jgi:type IV pilus assembly protein PilZ
MAEFIVNRRYPRVKPPAGLVVAWQTANRKLLSYVGGIGLGGLFIRTKEPLPVGSMIKILIDLPGDGVRARAVVRDVRPNEGMGVGIVSMEQDDRQRLGKFVSGLAA